MRALETTRGRTRSFGGAFAPRGRLRALIHVSLVVLSLLGWSWIVLAGSALWQWAAAADRFLGVPVAAAPAPDPPPPIAEAALLEAPPETAGPSSASSASAPSVAPHRARSQEGTAVPLPEPAEQSTAQSGALAATLEYHGAQCGGVFVYVVTLSERGPTHSAVSLSTSSSARSSFARPGERVGPWEVLAITDDWSGVNPAVWLVRDGEVCRTGLTGNPARVRAAREQARKKKSKKKVKRKRKRRRRRRRR